MANITGDISSGDDGYKAVEFISESDSDEPDVEKAEERNIIVSEDDENGAAPDRSTENATFWDGNFVDGGLFSADILQLEDPFVRADPHFASELEIYDATNSHRPDDSAPPATSKRVRFQDDVLASDSSGTAESDEDDTIFPDLFLQQDQLDPHFRRMIEDDLDNDDGGSGSTDGDGSYWDLRGSDDTMDDESQIRALARKTWMTAPAPAPGRGPHGHVEGSCVSSEGSSSGYESDEGETTDEDLPPPQSIARTRSVLRRPSTSSLSPDDETNIAAFRRTMQRSAAHRRGPSLGNWIADPSKPIAVIDSSGKRLVIFPAQRPSINTQQTFPATTANSSGTSTMNTSPHTPFASLVEDSDERSDFSIRAFNTSLAGSGANLMMGGLLHGAPGNEYIRGGQVLGPPEAFYPFRSVGSDGKLERSDVQDDDDDVEDDDDDDDEQMLNVHDFIDFGDDSSDSVENDGDDDTEAPTRPTTPTSTSESKAQTLEQHTMANLDHGIIGPSRRSQFRKKGASNPKNSKNSGQQPTPFLGHRAIKGGRQAAANSPISPKRKRRASMDMTLMGRDVRKRVSSAQKRPRSGFY